MHEVCVRALTLAPAHHHCGWGSLPPLLWPPPATAATVPETSAASVALSRRKDVQKDVWSN